MTSFVVNLDFSGHFINNILPLYLHCNLHDPWDEALKGVDKTFLVTVFYKSRAEPLPCVNVLTDVMIIWS